MANIEDILNLNIDSDEEPDFGSDTTYDSDADLIPYDGDNAVTPPLPPRRIVVDTHDAANDSSPPPPPPPSPLGAAAAAVDDVGAPIEEIASTDFRHDPSHSCRRCDVVNGTPGQLINAVIESWALKSDPRPLTKEERSVLDVMKAYGFMIDTCKK